MFLFLSAQRLCQLEQPRHGKKKVDTMYGYYEPTRSRRNLTNQALLG